MQRIVPELPPEIPRRGNAMTAWLGRTVLRVLGWRFEGEIPAHAKMVIIIGPHTSAWDVIVGLAGKLALRIDIAFLAKHTLFSWPLGVIFRRLGGIPIDRSGPHNVVEEMGRRFAESEQLILVLAPEGTRSHVDRWKSGFYYIAQKAEVPILPVVLDFGRRRIRFGSPQHADGDPKTEVAALKEFFADARGRRPELAS